MSVISMSRSARERTSQALKLVFDVSTSAAAPRRRRTSACAARRQLQRVVRLAPAECAGRRVEGELGAPGDAVEAAIAEGYLRRLDLVLERAAALLAALTPHLEHV